jgi:lysozyme family protein
MADHGASSGTGRPPKMIQFAVNQVLGTKLLLVDGQLGAKSISAINTVDQPALLKAFVQLRRDFYEYRAAVRTPAPAVLALLKDLNLRPDAKSKVFLNSWLARLPKL